MSKKEKNSFRSPFYKTVSFDQAHLELQRRDSFVCWSRLQRLDADDRERRAFIQSEDRRRGFRGRFCRLDEKLAVAASKTNGRGCAGQYAVRQTGVRVSCQAKIPSDLPFVVLKIPKRGLLTSVWGNLSLTRSLTGHFEVDCGSVEEHLAELLVVDVRTVEELASDKLLGKIPGAVALPLDELARNPSQLVGSKRPIVFVCRAGARSAQACVLLSKAGNSNCASLKHGLLRWNREGRITE